MPNPNIAKAGEGTRWQAGQSGNPAGTKPGTKHLATWIQEMMSKPTFEVEDLKGRKFKVAPIQAIVTVAMQKANEGDQKWADWLAKYGYGSKLQLGNDPDNPLTNPNALTDEELHARLNQIVATTEGRGLGDHSGTRSTKSKN